MPAAEDDRSTCDVLIPEGYEFRGGSYSVPDNPGLSVRVDEDQRHAALLRQAAQQRREYRQAQGEQ